MRNVDKNLARNWIKLQIIAGNGCESMAKRFKRIYVMSSRCDLIQLPRSKRNMLAENGAFSHLRVSEQTTFFRTTFGFVDVVVDKQKNFL